MKVQPLISKCTYYCAVQSTCRHFSESMHGISFVTCSRPRAANQFRSLACKCSSRHLQLQCTQCLNSTPLLSTRWPTIQAARSPQLRRTSLVLSASPGLRAPGCLLLNRCAQITRVSFVQRGVLCAACMCRSTSNRLADNAAH